MARDVWGNLAWLLARETWRAPARAARAVAEPIARLAREVAALRAGLADLADLDASWLIAEPDPLGASIDASRQAAIQEEGPARATAPGRWPRSASAGSDRIGSQRRPAEASSLARSSARTSGEPPWDSLTAGETPAPPDFGRSSSAPAEEQKSFGATRRQIASLDDAALIAAARRPIEGIAAPKDLLERWAGLAPEVGPSEAARAAPSGPRHPRGLGGNPARAHTLPRSGEDLTGQPLAAARAGASPTTDPAGRRERTRGVLPASSRFQEERAVSDATPAAAAARSLAQVREGEPAPQPADLLTRLTTRWWEAHKGEGGVPSTGSATSATARADELGAQGYASRAPTRAAFSAAPAEVERTSTEDAPAPWAAPAVQNTIHLTVQPPPGAGAFDADELADLLDRILRREAQRHGIPLL